MRPIYIQPPIATKALDRIEESLLALPWETKRTARHELFMAKSLDSCRRCGDVGATTESTSKNEACPVCNAARVAHGADAYIPIDYSYGRQDDGIVYTSKPWTPRVRILAVQTAQYLSDYGVCTNVLPPVMFNACFLNKYDDAHQHLGWTADDFVGMDPSAPIAMMSFGAEREIWIKRKFAPCPACDDNGTVDERDVVEGRVVISGKQVVCPHCHGNGGVGRVTGPVPPEDRFLLQRGSIFVMPPGFQEVMYHRIPKHPEPCGWRISLTFRKFL